MANNITKLPVANQPQPTTNAGPLSPQKVDQLNFLVHRLRSLLQQTIKSPNDDAEIKGILDNLRNEMVNHAEEFISSWICIHLEYQPLLAGVRGLLNRVDMINHREAQRIQSEAAQQQQQQSEAGSEQRDERKPAPKRSTTAPSNDVNRE